MRGIPTKYGSVQFRSRLEAKWAAFFDLLGWRWEYEPFDLDGWIPDFMLVGVREQVLVEVKPVTEIPLEVREKMLLACKGTEWEREVNQHSSCFRKHRMIVGAAPFADEAGTAYTGWTIQEAEPYVYKLGPGWGDRSIIVHPDGYFEAPFCRPDGLEHLDFMANDGWVNSLMFGEENWKDTITAVDFSEVQRLWREAGNIVQWRRVG